MKCPFSQMGIKNLGGQICADISIVVDNKSWIYFHISNSMRLSASVGILNIKLNSNNLFLPEFSIRCSRWRSKKIFKLSNNPHYLFGGQLPIAWNKQQH